MKKSSRASGAFLKVISVTLVALFVAVILARDGVSAPRITPDTIDDGKNEILAIVSADGPLTTEQRDALFLSLNGSKMLKYHFSDTEKGLILDAINNRKQQDKKSSSAKENFSRRRLARANSQGDILSQEHKVV